MQVNWFQDSDRKAKWNRYIDILFIMLRLILSDLFIYHFPPVISQWHLLLFYVYFSREKIFTNSSYSHSQKFCPIIVTILNAKLVFENTGYFQ